jgi:hypothetical protein
MLQALLINVRVSIYVAYLRPMYYAMQQKESIPEHLFTGLIILNATY